MNLYESPTDTSKEKLWTISSVFLAGSIEMGKAVDWQSELISKLSHLNINVFNPRRKDWDSSLAQSFDNPQFREQVEWELHHMEQSDIVIFYFDPDTMSPITLFELGLNISQSDKSDYNDHLIVYCPEKYFRKGNIDIITNWYGIEQVYSIDAIVDAIEQRI